MCFVLRELPTWSLDLKLFLYIVLLLTFLFLLFPTFCNKFPLSYTMFYLPCRGYRGSCVLQRSNVVYIRLFRSHFRSCCYNLGTGRRWSLKESVVKTSLVYIVYIHIRYVKCWNFKLTISRKPWEIRENGRNFGRLLKGKFLEQMLNPAGTNYRNI